jgi:heptosyltransferase III
MAKSKLRIAATRHAKPLELFGRRVLQWLLSIALAVRARPAVLPDAPRVLVVRLDPRIGNQLLLTPFLASVKALWPQAHVTVLCHESMQRVYARQPSVSAMIPYVKWKWGQGPVSLLMRLRRERFDVVFDAGSYSTVAVTHPIVARLSGAPLIVGSSRGGLSRLYHVVAPPIEEDAPEIEQRLALLKPFSNESLVREMVYVAPGVLASLRDEAAAFIAAAAPHGVGRTVVCVVGARLEKRRIPEALWGDVLSEIAARGLFATIVWGPSEEALARRIVALRPEVTLAPPSSLDELAALVSVAHGMIGHDTGTSHLAVAVGARTLVMFVFESPRRYGHTGVGRDFVDLRAAATQEKVVNSVRRWLDDLDAQANTLGS